MTNTNILNVLDAIGKALEAKDTEISVLQYNLESTKKALANAEAKVQELQEELHGFYDKAEDIEMTFRPEITA